MFPIFALNSQTMYKSTRLIVLLFAIFQYNNLYPQQRLDFNYIGGKEGLTENVVNDIVQDKNGFIWLATNDGLNRYDGYNILVSGMILPIQIV